MKKNNIRIKIFFTVWMIYLLFIYVKLESMSGQLVDLAMSIVDNGNVYLRYASHLDASFLNGHYLLGHVPGASLLVVPVYLIFKPALSGLAGTSKLIAANILSIVFISSVFGALIATIFYSILERLNVSRRDSIFLTFILAFGTMVFGGSVYFSKDLLAVLYVFAAFFMLFRERFNKEYNNMTFFWAGLLLVLGIVTNTAVISACAVLFLYGFYIGGIKKLPAMLAGALIPALGLLIYLKITFGSFYTNPYQFRFKPDGNTFIVPNFKNFFHIFFSWREGFFIYMPVMILSLWGIAEAFRKRLFRPETTVITSIFLLTGILFSGYVRKNNPLEIVASHDTSLVIRYLLVLCPFMMLAIALVISRVKRGVLYFLGGVSVFFSYLGAQVGCIPYGGGWPFIYTSKVFISSFGLPTLFSDTLPKAAGIITFHTYVSRSDVTLAQVLSLQNRQLLMALLRNQLFFCAIFMTALVLVAFIIRILWRKI